MVRTILGGAERTERRQTAGRKTTAKKATAKKATAKKPTPEKKEAEKRKGCGSIGTTGEASDSACLSV